MKKPIMLEILAYKSNFENARAGPGWDPGWGPSGVGSFRGGVIPGSQGWRFPRRESPRGLGPSDEPIKKHYAYIKMNISSMILLVKLRRSA